MQIQYIGSVTTRVRVSGNKITVEPQEVFEMSAAEGKDLTSGPYRDLFIVEGADLTPKQNVENKKAPAASIAFGSQNDQEDDKDEEEEEKVKEPSDEEKSEAAAFIATTIEKINATESIDALNDLSTEIANDEVLSEDETIAEALDAKMFGFLNEEETDKPEGEPEGHKNAPIPDVEDDEDEVPLAQGKEKPAKGKKAI